MATDARDGAAWYGTGEAVNRVRGRVFRYACFAATLFGLAMVGVFLFKVFLDAVRPTTADTGWHLTFLVTLVVPTAAVGAFYALRDRVAGWNGAVLTAAPLFGTILGTGVVLVFVQVFSPLQWFHLTIGLAVTALARVAHRRVRPAAGGERNLVTAVVFVLAVIGIPRTGLGFAVISWGELVLIYAPVLPSDLAIVVLTLAVPTAAFFGAVVRDRWESARAGYAAAGSVLVAAALGFVVALSAGAPAWNGVVVALATFLPTAMYGQAVLHDGEHRTAFLLPAVVFGGALLGGVLVRQFGFAGPNAWIDWQFLTALPSRFPEQAGFYPAIVGSVMIMLVIIVGIFPIGVAAAIYLEEYAPNEGILGSVVDLIELNIANLAGVPSVVYGLLALGVFINTLGMGVGIVVVGGLAVGLLILPIIIISSQEAIRAVPDSLRQASYGMGATKWQTVRNIVLPEALPGILTGSIIAFGRAIGETAPLLMIGVAAAIFRAPSGFFDVTSAMPRQIFTWSSQPDAAFRYGVLAAGVVTLLVVLLSMNAAAILIRNKYQQRT